MLAKSGYETDNMVGPRLVSEVVHLVVTIDCKLRAPSLNRLRNDKAPVVCTGIWANVNVLIFNQSWIIILGKFNFQH